MNISLNFIKEYAPGLRISQQDLADKITTSICEIEGVHATEDKNDSIFEIDNKSITNRPDLWGHRGMARDIAALCGTDFKDATLDPLPSQLLPYEAARPSDGSCSIYIATQIDNIDGNVSSPRAMQDRLNILGFRPINLCVDLTNYVLAEFGQPLHVFDADKVSGNIQVRYAKKGEKIQALDDKEYELQPEDLVIADQKSVLAIAGIMGGSLSAVSSQTKRIILESACFMNTKVRTTSKRLGLRSESSQRFEKGLDPENAVLGARRFLTLLKQSAPQAKIMGTSTSRQPLSQPPVLTVTQEYFSKLGYLPSAQEITQTLSRLGFSLKCYTKDGKNIFEISIPTHRRKDVTGTHDILEEVGRILGYERIPATSPLLPVTSPIHNEARSKENNFKRWARSLGYHEVITYPDADPKAYQNLSLPLPSLEMCNPMNEEKRFLRNEITPHLLEKFEANRRHQNHVSLFEVGRIYTPTEEKYVCAFITNERDLLSDLVEILGQPIRGKHVLLHPFATAHWSDCSGYCGTIFPKIRDEYRADETTQLAWFDLSGIIKAQEVRIYEPIPRYPNVPFDLAIILPIQEDMGKILQTIHRYPHVHRVEIFDEFFGLENGTKKSVGFRTIFQKKDGTFAETEISDLRNGLINTLRDAGLTIRGVS